jgi:chemotaxis protein MotB
MRKRIENQQKNDHWISYSDLMSGLLLVMILFLVVAIMNYNEDREILNEQEEKLQNQEKRIEDIVGIRSEIIYQLIDSFEKANIIVEIDKDTGDIMLSSGVFFDYNSYKLKTSGKEFLDKFIPLYFEVLLMSENRDHISEIIIEGHTDDSGGYIYNLELSQKRALEVSKYILSEAEKMGRIENENLREILTSNGRSYSNLIYSTVNGRKTVNKEQSRRVEFKFSLKNDELIEEINTILKGES